MRVCVVVFALAVTWLTSAQGHARNIDEQHKTETETNDELIYKRRDIESLEEEANNVISKTGPKYGIESEEVKTNNEIPNIGPKYGIESEEVQINNEIPKTGPKYGIESEEVKTNNEISKTGPKYGIESEEVQINNEIPKTGPKYGIESAEEEANNVISKTGPKYGIESEEQEREDLPDTGPRFGIDSSEESSVNRGFNDDTESSGDLGFNDYIEGSAEGEFWPITESPHHVTSSFGHYTTEFVMYPMATTVSPLIPKDPGEDEKVSINQVTVNLLKTSLEGDDVAFEDPNELAIFSSPQWRALMVLTATNAEMKDPAFLAKWVNKRSRVQAGTEVVPPLQEP